MLGMNQACFDFFQAVRFLADVLDPIDVNVTPLQQSNGLFTASRSVRIGTLRFRMVLVLARNFVIRLHARGLPVSVVRSS